MISTSDALYSLRPNSEYVIGGDKITWLDAVETKPTQAEIDDEMVRLKSEYDSLSYSRARADAYASLPDQADMQYWDAVNGTTVWKDHIADIKSKHPKENK